MSSSTKPTRNRTFLWHIIRSINNIRILTIKRLIHIPALKVSLLDIASLSTAISVIVTALRYVKVGIASTIPYPLSIFHGACRFVDPAELGVETEETKGTVGIALFGVASESTVRVA